MTSLFSLREEEPPLCMFMTEQVKLFFLHLCDFLYSTGPTLEIVKPELKIREGWAREER